MPDGEAHRPVMLHRVESKQAERGMPDGHVRRKRVEVQTIQENH
jgi:hypothetical protein